MIVGGSPSRRSPDRFVLLLQAELWRPSRPQNTCSLSFLLSFRLPSNGFAVPSPVITVIPDVYPSPSLFLFTQSFVGGHVHTVTPPQIQTHAHSHRHAHLHTQTPGAHTPCSLSCSTFYCCPLPVALVILPGHWATSQPTMRKPGGSPGLVCFPASPRGTRAPLSGPLVCTAVRLLFSCVCCGRSLSISLRCRSFRCPHCPTPPSSPFPAAVPCFGGACSHGLPF